LRAAQRLSAASGSSAALPLGWAWGRAPVAI
jgi:hypothetical protein